MTGLFGRGHNQGRNLFMEIQKQNVENTQNSERNSLIKMPKKTFYNNIG